MVPWKASTPVWLQWGQVSHSWTGNLLTNHTWEHFWLNEGWTVWLERRIEAKMHGETWYAFSSLEANDSLQEAVSRYGDSHNFTKLVPTLRDIDPDDAFSCIPYEKGFQFIHFLGEVIGSKAFPEYVTAYIGEFKMKTLTSDEFKAFTISWCGGRGVDLSAVDWDEWLHAPGMPPVRLSLANVEGERAKELAAQWLRPQSEMDPSGCPEGAAAGAPQGWRHQHWLVFFGCLSSEIDSEPSHALSLERLLRMDEAYGFSASRNAEVRFRWQRLCIKLRADFIVPQVVDFLKSQGRMKFVRPLFRELNAWPEHAHVATQTFEEWGGNYHPIARKMLAQDLAASA
uniref:Peptidase M1 leukotriene A4 hydrolase/aminopeptidase C-terminal domain-containing protein n=1 Tax=Chrysotila carterae TaxID=13221 RepID=A0A7S4BEG6_CHRCT